MALKKKVTIPKDSPLSRIVAQRTGGWLLAGVDSHLESSGAVRMDPGWFHPSSLSSPCDALLAFQYMGTKGKSSIRARTQRIFDLGSSRDEDWKRYLHESKISLLKHWGGSPKERKLADEERYIEIPDIRLRGAFDDLVFNETTHESAIFEFKTMNDDEWKKLRAPKSEHITQVHPYMFARGVLQAMIVYENKNTQETKSYIIKFDGGLWDGIVMRLKNIIHLVENRTLPWRTPMQNDSQCAFFWTCGSFSFPEEDDDKP